MAPEPSSLPRGSRTFARFVNGLSLLLDGTTRGEMGNAAKEVIHKEWNLEVTHLLPTGEVLHATPVLFVPPLMVRPYVYDLRPDHSFVRTLRDRGYAVYIVDFGVPDANDAHLKLDHYVFTFLPTAVEAVLRHAGARDLSLVGYCMGGIFSLLYAAAHHPSLSDGARASRVRNLVTVGAPINFEKLGVLTLAAGVGHGYIDQVLDRMGNVPSLGAELGFKLMGGTRTLTKWADLFIHLYDEEYVRGFDAINTWVNDLLPYPREAFRQLVHEVIAGNKILKRELVLAGRRIDLGVVDAPLLAFAGRTDNIATPGATRDVLGCVGSTDKAFVEVPGGHVGVVGGAIAPAAVWNPTADWLATRSA